MPYYEYRCAENGKTLEVRHGMDERIETWGALIEKAGVTPDGTPEGASVERLLSAPVPHTGSGEGPVMGGCGARCGCGPRA